MDSADAQNAIRPDWRTINRFERESWTATSLSHRQFWQHYRARRIEEHNTREARSFRLWSFR
jgi:hypothetical protein